MVHKHLCQYQVSLLSVFLLCTLRSVSFLNIHAQITHLTLDQILMSISSRLVIFHTLWIYSKPPFGQSLGSHRVKSVALLRVREVLGLENFEFPVLLDKEKDECQEIGLVALMFFFELLFSYVSLAISFYVSLTNLFSIILFLIC